MGLKSWFSRREKPDAAEASPTIDLPLFPLDLGLPFNKDVEVSGTMTFAHDDVLALMKRRNMTSEHGYLEAVATLQPDPDNPVEANAIEVLVDGIRVGCLLTGLGKSVRQHTTSPVNASYQLHTFRTGDKVKAKAFVWLDNSHPSWSYSKSTPAPLMLDTRAKEAEAGHKHTVQEGLKAGGTRQKEFENALVGGVHYLELVEPIKQLKREGKLREALKLCYVAIESAERGKSGGCPAPFYTIQAAIVHRKLRERDEEVAVLKRWMAASPKRFREGSRVAERLAKIELSNR
ncbi:hypothetical protein [Glutamicibacter sp. Je.9.36]|uniref:hypothetical protein n=1 Tax=Glutamicibacter sp. Je.9.36 TaxID=3142837 RepID=UPI003DA868F4